MESVFKYLVVFSVGFFVSFALLPLLMRLAPKVGLMDIPRDRHIHKKPTPRCGGIAIFLGFHCACWTYFHMAWPEFSGQLNYNWWISFLIPSSFLLLVGIADDRWNLPPLIKLACQIAAAVLAFSLGIRVGDVMGWQMPFYLELFATIFWFLIIINAFNLIDGLDGLATGLAIIATIGLAGSFIFYHVPRNALIISGFLGACIAFLRYNFHPARCFLGDAGSMFLGFTLAAMALSTTNKGSAISTLGIPLLAFGVPVFDEMLAVWRRTVSGMIRRKRGEKPTGKTWCIFQGDVDHLHHRLARAGLSQSKVAMLLYAINAICVVLGLLLLWHNSRTAGAFLILFVIAVYVTIKRLVRTELWTSSLALANGLTRPSGKSLHYFLFPLADAVLLCLIFIFSVNLINPNISDVRSYCFERMPFYVGIPLLVLLLSNNYNKIWAYARIADYFIFVAALLGGLIATIGSISILDGDTSQYQLQQALIYFGGASIFMLGYRLMPRLVFDVATSLQSEGKNYCNILIYGANYRTVLLINELAYELIHHQNNRTVVGIIDDKRAFHGNTVYGKKVLGGTDDLPQILRDKNIQEIITTVPLAEQSQLKLTNIARTAGIRLAEWRMEAGALTGQN